jgi:hypothetical protein
MSGPFPCSWDVGSRTDVHGPDDELCRVWDALDDAGDFDPGFSRSKIVCGSLGGVPGLGMFAGFGAKGASL